MKSNLPGLAFMLLTAPALAQTARFDMRQIQGLGPPVFAADLNNAGAVVGWSGTTPRAFLETAQGVVDLAALLPPHLGSVANSIDEAGNVVGGFTTISPLVGYTFLYDGSGVSVVTSGADVIDEPLIADGGIVAGDSLASGLFGRARVWRAGLLVDVGASFPGFLFSPVSDVNRHGQVVGFLLTNGTDTTPSPFLWDRGVPVMIGGPGFEGRADEINDRGQIAGIDLAGGLETPFLWDPVLGFAPLGPPNVDPAVEGLNEYGAAVGAASVNGVTRAVLWANGAMLDLNDFIAPVMGSSLTRGLQINDSGQILCQALVFGQVQFVLLTPKP